MSKLTEKRVDDEDRKVALAEFLGVEVDEITDYRYGNHAFECESESGAWEVLTDDEADEEFYDYEISMIDDLGLDSFTENFQEWILENAIDESWFEQVAEEESDYYISEMDDEELLDYAKNHKLVKKDLDIDDFDRDDVEEDCKSEYKDEILKDGMSYYFESIYGRHWAKEMKDQLINEIDWDVVIDELKDREGRGSIASYDGEENEVKSNGTWFYIYQID